MPKKMLIYKSAVPVNKDRHRNWSVRVGDFGFARETILVPLLTAEFASAAREYPIIISKTDGGYMSAALVGLHENENLFVTARNRWDARYIPACIRRYPFVFVKVAQKVPRKFALCIDEAYAGCNTHGDGENLFDSNAKETEYLKRMVKLSGNYEREFAATKAFCERLSDLGILAPQRITFVPPDGVKRSINGLLVVKKDLLQALPGRKLSELAQSGDLERIYALLLSLGNLQSLASRLSVIN